MNGTQLRVSQNAYQEGLSGLLKGENGVLLVANVGLVILADLHHQALKGSVSDEQVSALLVSANFTESNGARAEAMGSANSSFGHSGLGHLGALETLAGHLTTGADARSLLSTRHECKLE